MYRRGNNGSFAQYEIHDAWLFTEFGESYARRVFGDEIVNNLPHYVRGKHAGKPKGQIVWLKVSKGGWATGFGVVAPDLTFCHGLFEIPWGGKPVLLNGFDAYDKEQYAAALLEKREKNESAK